MREYFMYEFEAAKYTEFFRDFNVGKYGAQRLGQAFFNEFNLHKSVQGRDVFDTLWNLDGEEALEFIHTAFTFN